MAYDEEKMDDIIREIALKNGVAVSRRDPIMIVHTMNSQLLKEGKVAQHEVLEIFKSELEGIAHQWGEDAKQKAEKILNASLTASKEAMNNGMKEGAERAGKDLALIIDKSTEQMEKLAESTRRVVYINLGVSVLVILAIISALVK